MRSSAALVRCLARTSASRAAHASPAELIPATNRFYHTPRTSILRRPLLAPPSIRCMPPLLRHESTTSKLAPQTSSPTTNAPESRLDRDQVPAYELTFTCKKCSERSSHRVSKQGYHHGTVLITCPGCKNRHLISDHLKIFSDKAVTIEDLMREKGQLVKRGSLSTDGDLEFWDDGSTSPRSSNFVPNSNTKGDPDAQEGRLTEPPASQTSQSNTKD